jgi:DNA-binding response OmpR family regulator
VTDTVLVVDDTPSKRYVLASWLRRGGFAVIEASTGAEAIEVVRRGGVDLVVLDVRLPDMSGFEVCEEIKGDPVHGTTPIVHVSAAAIHADDRTQGLQRGADAYLVEPIDPDELLATTTSILRYYQARKQAETLAARLESLARTTLVMSAATSQTGVLREAAMGLARIFASPVAIVVPADDGGRIAATCAGPGEPALVRPSAAYSGADPVGITLADHPAARWPQVAWPAGATLRALALRTRTDRSSIYVVVPITPTMPGDPVLTLFAQGLASALESMRNYDREHDLALTLQRSLLPQTVPALPGYDLAVRYVPASDIAEIGGDFYEVVRFGDTAMIAVGDVGGHSLHAATVMAELRHATRAYLADAHLPAAVLDRVNQLMCRLMPGETATMCLLSLDLAEGVVRLANAGHPPPLLRTAEGMRAITDHSPLLGIQVRPAIEVELRLMPGDVLLLYTDGLIEQRGETFDDSLVRLAAAATETEADLEAYASRLLREVGPAEPADDVAMVAVRRVEFPTGAQ